MDCFNEFKAVARFSEILAEGSGLPPATVRKIRIAALLHDIGKLKIPKEILYKPAKLDAQEFEVMKTHTKLGASILASVQGEIGGIIRDVCLHHHEFYNGQGYWGVRASELPLYVQIISVADVAAALLSKRPYKEAWPLERVTEYIQSRAGEQFSPELAEAFASLVGSDNRVPAVLNMLNT